MTRGIDEARALERRLGLREGSCRREYRLDPRQVGPKASMGIRGVSVPLETLRGLLDERDGLIERVAELEVVLGVDEEEE
jgi:hypothetical protein